MDGEQVDRDRWSNAEVNRRARGVVRIRLERAGFDAVEEAPLGFAARSPNGKCYGVFVKGTRLPNHFFEPKRLFSADDDQVPALTTFFEDEPADVYLIPGSTFRNIDPSLTRLIKNRDYAGGVSEPDYGINVTERTLPLLRRFKFDNMIQTFK